MQMIYNSPNYCVVEFPPQDGHVAMCSGGYEIVDKNARREIFIVRCSWHSVVLQARLPVSVGRVTRGPGRRYAESEQDDATADAAWSVSRAGGEA